MIRFFTAAFGSAYVPAARALLRSAELFASETNITIYTDLPTCFRTHTCTTISICFDELLTELDEFHRSSRGQLRNAFKFSLFRRMRQRYPSDDICWIDADMLIFCELSKHIVPGHINVIAHGRRDDEVIACGDGLNIRGDRYAIGGLYSLPPGPALDFLLERARERPHWTDVAPLVRGSGDQITLNHLVARSGLPIHWLSDNRRYIYNLEIAENKHPVVGDIALTEITLHEGRPTRDGRYIAVFYWIKNKLDAHLTDNFSTFRPEVATILQNLYAPN
jgi:hypothetical protein